MKLLLQGFCLLLFVVHTAHAVDETRESVVRLHVTQRAPDLRKPWTKSVPRQVSGSGAIISGGRILTNAHVVHYAKQIFVQLHQGGDRLPAKLIATAPQIDLAVVELENPEHIADISALEIAEELPAIKSTVNVYGYPLGGEDLSITEGIVSRIEFTRYYYDGVGLRVQVDAALNSGNSGGPAMQDGKVIGLVFSGVKEAENIGYLIPAPEINSFLDDIADGEYSGKPQLFDQFVTTENDALRDFLKLESSDTGMIVAQPYQDTEDYPLKRWDVVTHIGPHNVDNQGYVFIGDHLRLRFGYYVEHLFADGSVELTINRNGESMVVHVPVSPQRATLLPILKNEQPRYFIYGPFTFTVGTQEYIRAMGRTGLQVLSRLDSPLLKRLYEPPAFPEEELVMVAARPFPHRITKGYNQSPFGVVVAMNDTEIKNLRHFAEMLRDCTDEFIKLDLAGKSESMVFRRSELKESTEEILTDEGIRYQSSKDLRDIWD